MADPSPVNDQDLSATVASLVQAQFYARGIRQSLETWREMKAVVTRNRLRGLRTHDRLLCVGFQLDQLELDGPLESAAFPVPVEFRNVNSYAALLESGLKPDIALFRSHQFWNIDGSYDLSALPAAARDFPACVGLVWLWDHHHDFQTSATMALLTDIVLPMHETGADYLRACNDFVFTAVPAASAQWGGPGFIQEVFRANETIARSNRLYGGFVEYAGFPRNAFIRRCMAAIDDHALNLLPNEKVRDIQHFGTATRRDRLVEWMGHKCSLVCALVDDVPIRIIDGLLAGQIPLVPHNLAGFDRLISPTLQRTLPVVRYDAYDVESVKEAWQTAIRLFDRDGVAGAARRHRYALDNHLPKHRLVDIVLAVMNSAQLYRDA